MELELFENGYINGKNELLEIENDLVFGLLKSSDLNASVINEPRKYTIITQTQVGQSTDYIKSYPKTYKYLIDNVEYFNRRKSSIYKNKPFISSC